MRHSSQPMPTAFRVVVCDQGTTRTITPHGELDLATVDEARGPLTTALSEGFETVVLDLAETTFIDSTGVRLIFETDARASADHHRFVVLPGPPAVQRVFEICGLRTLGYSPAANAAEEAE